METPLMNTLLILAAMAQVVDQGAIVFGRDAWYQAVKGDEETFTGIVKRIPGTGLNSRTAFCLVMALDGQNTTRDIFVGGNANNQALAGLHNSRVRITGVAIDLKVDGRMKYEIWPAKIEVTGGGVIGAIGGLGGLGSFNLVVQVAWQCRPSSGPAVRVGVGQLQLVARSQDELLRIMNNNQIEVNRLYNALGVRSIDFRKNMVLLFSGGVCKSGGYTVELVGMDLIDRVLLVRWNLRPPLQGQVVNATLTHPGKVVVVPRYDGI